MFLTAKEAPLYWCPFTGIRPGASDPDQQRLSRCLGPGCAAWRFKPASDSLGTSEKGFCGLAGKPQIWDD